MIQSRYSASACRIYRPQISILSDISVIHEREFPGWCHCSLGRRRFEQLRQFLHTSRDALEGREREWWSKIQANILHLAGTLCFLDWAMKDDGPAEPQCIDEGIMSAAVRLVCWSVSILGRPAPSAHRRYAG